MIAADESGPADADIQMRIAGIFSEIESLTKVEVGVSRGVVRLSGEVANAIAADRAMRLAARLEGVVSVEDEMQLTLDVESNVAPVIDQFQEDLKRWRRGLPLYGLAIVVGLAIALFAHVLGGWTAFWRRVTRNEFLGELVGQAVRVLGIILGLVVTLNILGATTIMGAILGSAGVAGLAVGFAVKDTIENYVASIMLSIRQPFRARDHVVINDRQGIVVRLNSRATILMTMDGNHLRIPNAEVFKGVILNYTRNPERRFDFDLGVDSADDPVAAMQAGLDAISELDFILDEPGPSSVIKNVGDSNIVLSFFGWVNQANTDFFKARSLAIRAAMRAIEENGFTMPEPIYRVRLDTGIDVPLTTFEGAGADESVAAPTPHPVTVDADMLDVSPDTHIADKVEAEQREEGGAGLLDEDRPVE